MLPIREEDSCILEECAAMILLAEKRVSELKQGSSLIEYTQSKQINILAPCKPILLDILYAWFFMSYEFYIIAKYMFMRVATLMITKRT